MNRNILKSIFKTIIWGIILAILLFLIAIIIKHFKDYSLNDILFIEGIIFLIGALFSAISGNPMGLSMQSLGQINTQYNANANLEVKKIEQDNHNNKININIDIKTISLIIGTIIIIVLSFII